MKASHFTTALAALAITSSMALAIDHKILDDDRPLRLEDPYTKAHGEFGIEAGVRFENNRHGRNQAVFPIELSYGLFPNFHIELGTDLHTTPRDLEEPHHSGDLHIAALYNFNVETVTMPALGLKGTATFPTGIEASGTDFEIKGLFTKSIGHVSFHLNAAYEWIGSPESGGRDGRYRVVFGPSYPIGAPQYTRTTLLAAAFLEQSHRRGGKEIVGVEAGFRHQLTQRVVLDAGLGTEFRGPADRTSFFVTTGFAFAF